MTLAPALRGLDRDAFRARLGGRQVDLLVLEGSGGLAAAVTTYGARIVALTVPSGSGDPVDVVLGHPSLAAYLADRGSYHGAIIGRYANRIGGACFAIDAVEFMPARNDGANSLHGGHEGFDSRVWEVVRSDGRTLLLRLVSPDGDQGYPGNLTVEVGYTIEPDGMGLGVSYTAWCDCDTAVNLTSHAYFNLAGEGRGTIEDHELAIDASFYTPVDQDLIPTGEIAPVAGTPFDFIRPASIGDRLAEVHPQLAIGRGFDHNLVLDGGVTAEPRRAARLFCPRSGIAMTVLTTEPGLQLYSGNQLDGSRTGKSGLPHGWRGGLCLETQHFPDSPNQPAFPSTLLRPGGRFRSRTIYRFEPGIGR